MNTLELAQPEELEICYGIVDAGRNFQREQGFIQWTEEYPNLDTIRDDIQNKKGYVLKVDGCIAGYMCIDFGGDPAYDNIEGKWSAEEPYAVVHRMAFDSAFRGRGLADVTFRLIEELCLSRNVRYIRVDTDFPNKRMQHIFTKNGYKYCGVIIFQGRKMAFDKIL